MGRFAHKWPRKPRSHLPSQRGAGQQQQQRSGCECRTTEYLRPTHRHCRSKQQPVPASKHLKFNTQHTTINYKPPKSFENGLTNLIKKPELHPTSQNIHSTSATCILEHPQTQTQIQLKNSNLLDQYSRTKVSKVKYRSPRLANRICALSFQHLSQQMCFQTNKSLLQPGSSSSSRQTDGASRSSSSEQPRPILADELQDGRRSTHTLRHQLYSTSNQLHTPVRGQVTTCMREEQVITHSMQQYFSMLSRIKNPTTN